MSQLDLHKIGCTLSRQNTMPNTTMLAKPCRLASARRNGRQLDLVAWRVGVQPMANTNHIPHRSNPAAYLTQQAQDRETHSPWHKSSRTVTFQLPHTAGAPKMRAQSQPAKLGTSPDLDRTHLYTYPHRKHCRHHAAKHTRHSATNSKPPRQQPRHTNTNTHACIVTACGSLEPSRQP
jgi:hypothetical protein